jgi:hypothetical protein
LIEPIEAVFVQRPEQTEDDLKNFIHRQSIIASPVQQSCSLEGLGTPPLKLQQHALPADDEQRLPSGSPSLPCQRSGTPAAYKESINLVHVIYLLHSTKNILQGEGPEIVRKGKDGKLSLSVLSNASNSRSK